MMLLFSKLVTILFFSGLDHVMTCSVPVGPPIKLQPPQVRAKKAEIVVYAKVIDIFPASPGGEYYTAQFKLLCLLKTMATLQEREEDLMGIRTEDDHFYFNVSGLGFAQGRCLRNEVEKGKNYFLFIREEIESESDLWEQFEPDEVNNQLATLPDTIANRNALNGLTRNCTDTLHRFNLNTSTVPPEDSTTPSRSFLNRMTSAITTPNEIILSSTNATSNVDRFTKNEQVGDNVAFTTSVPSKSSSLTLHYPLAALLLTSSVLGRFFIYC